MDQEFKRMPGSIAISNQGFEVSVITGMDVSVEYKDAGRQASIPAERVMNGGIGLFMDWANFPEGASAEEKRSIFERVIRALWFMDIPIGEIEINPAEKKWPLPPRPAR
jgi:hypothetical protein